MGGSTRFELAFFAFTVRRFARLSYNPQKIETTSVAGILFLSYWCNPRRHSFQNWKLKFVWATKSSRHVKPEGFWAKFARKSKLSELNRRPLILQSTLYDVVVLSIRPKMEKTGRQNLKWYGFSIQKKCNHLRHSPAKNPATKIRAIHLGGLTM